MNDIEDYRLILESIETILNNNETDTTKVDTLKHILNFYKELDSLEEPIGKEFSYIWNRNMRETTVVNIRTDEYDVQIDRTTRWGNPFPIGKHSRREVIELYKHWISKEIQEGRVTREDLNTLRGRRLGCWCKPLSCHGDVLAKLADSIDDLPSF